jgi:LysM repeat protein
MAENGSDDEKTILGKSVRNKIKYGTVPSGYDSTSAPSSDSTELYIKHPVLDGETLVSIALKYGLKTSYLQRVNHLWNDCIFWRQFLYIPVSTSDSIPTNYKGEIFTKTDIKKSLSKSTSRGQLSESKDSPRDKEKSCSVQETNSLSTAKDYFSKFDSSLAKIKDNVDRLEKQSS